MLFDFSRAKKVPMPFSKSHPNLSGTLDMLGRLRAVAADVIGMYRRGNPDGVGDAKGNNELRTHMHTQDRFQLA